MGSISFFFSGVASGSSSLISDLFSNTSLLDSNSSLDSSFLGFSFVRSISNRARKSEGDRILPVLFDGRSSIGINVLSVIEPVSFLFNSSKLMGFINSAFSVLVESTEFDVFVSSFIISSLGILFLFLDVLFSSFLSESSGPIFLSLALTFETVSFGDSSIGFSSSTILFTSFFCSSVFELANSVFREFSVLTEIAFLTILFLFAGTSGVALLEASACSSKIA